MKQYHRLCSLLLALLLILNLSACQRRTEPEAPLEPPVQQEEVTPSKPESTPEKEPEPPEEKPSPIPKEPYIFPSERDYPDSEAGAEQRAFDEFILEEFISSLENDYLSIHNTLLDPSVFGIDKSAAEITIGETLSAERIAEAQAGNLELKEQFEAFDYDLLTEEQQETYRLYQYLLENAITSLEGNFPYMVWEFSPIHGLQTAIPSFLMEYDFYSIEDVDAYMTMMRDIPRYARDALEFTYLQAEMGYSMADAVINLSRDYCEKIIDAGSDSALLSTVLYKLEHCELLDESQKRKYCAEAEDIILNEILPCYQNIYDSLLVVRERKNTNSKGLCYLEDGKEYYEFLFRQRSSSDCSINDAKALLKSYLELSLQEIERIASEDPQLYRNFLYIDVKLNFSGIQDVILDLEEKVQTNFPYIDPVDYTISYLDSELAVDGIGAYYVVPPLDSNLSQKIKVNPNGIDSESSISTYTLLAHEGLPGHLYQNNYVLQNLTEPFRQNTTLPGYSEGYATYMELISLNYLADQLDPDYIRLEQCYTIFNNCLVALCDIGIHYDGWTVKELENFCEQYIVMEDGDGLYYQLLGDPAVFQSYYMGLVEFLELRREAKETLGKNFDETEFHEVLLKGGDLPFSMIHENLEEYLADKNS